MCLMGVCVRLYVLVEVFFEYGVSGMLYCIVCDI